MNSFVKEFYKIRNILEKNDGVISFPTDTVWGVGCRINNVDAVEKIYDLKGRDKSKPLILLGNDIESLLPYIVKNIPPSAQKIIEKYFPGAVTLVLAKSNKVPDYITSALNTVGIRVPDCFPYRNMVSQCVGEKILATTSANLSGWAAGINYDDVYNSIGDYVDYIYNPEYQNTKELESTVVMVDEFDNIKVLRQGAIEINL